MTISALNEELSDNLLRQLSTISREQKPLTISKYQYGTLRPK
jgi:hypothetical protein